MRCVLAGIFLLHFLTSAALCLAETKGEVQSIGFQWMYRPNCHIPMLVRVQADKSGTYQIRVVQEDMDRDQQIFMQPVSLTGSEEGGTGEQRFWLYFIPQPTEGGLSNLTLRELQQQLKVFLCDEKGKQIAQLPVTQTIMNADAVQGGPFAISRGNRMVLAVADSTVQPVWRDYQQAIGLLEDVLFVPVRSLDLPEDVRGYECVDAIVWLGADVPDPSKAADEKRYHALRQYVRGGGHLIICQPAQREATVNFEDLLPVTITQVSPKNDLEPLRSIAKIANDKRRERNRAMNLSDRDALLDGEDPTKGPSIDDWDRPRGPFLFARAQLKPGAITEELLSWDAAGKDRTPWLARIGYGAGCVSWVAQDLSDPAITARAKSGWPYVWDRVLDYHNDLLITDARTDDKAKAPYQPGAVIDVGHALLGGMELTSKSRALVSIAVVFFIAYWVVAGPGVYFYLLTKSKPQFSWFLFAFSALVATLLTVLVVRLVVRAPEISHLTVVRAPSGDQPISMSRFGLYVPRDEPQEVKLPEVQPKEVSYLTAYPEHPSHAQGDIEFPAQMPYVVPLRDANSDEPVAITLQFRSTLKKFEARRVGPVGGLVQGNAKLRPTAGGNNFDLEGILTNGTSHRLRNVYIVYHDPSSRQDDVIVYAPLWEKSQSFDLRNDFDPRTTKWIRPQSEENTRNGYPRQDKEAVRIWGVMGKPGTGEIPWSWSRYWYAKDFRTAGYGTNSIDDMTRDVPSSFVMLSLFSRLPPMRNLDVSKPDRTDLLRRGGRYLDISAAVAAGRLIVLAEAEGEAELPFPLEVQGDKVPGKGRIFYQFILPLDHPAGTEALSTQPATSGPAVDPATFDPATYTGGKGNLSDEQWQRVQEYRQQQSQNSPEEQNRQKRQAPPGRQRYPTPRR